MGTGIDSRGGQRQRFVTTLIALLHPTDSDYWLVKVLQGDGYSFFILI